MSDFRVDRIPIRFNGRIWSWVTISEDGEILFREFDGGLFGKTLYRLAKDGVLHYLDIDFVTTEAIPAPRESDSAEKPDLLEENLKKLEQGIEAMKASLDEKMPGTSVSDYMYQAALTWAKGYGMQVAQLEDAGLERDRRAIRQAYMQFLRQIDDVKLRGLAIQKYIEGYSAA